jgi:hypothetical protein
LPSYLTPTTKIDAVRLGVVGWYLSLAYPAGKEMLARLPASLDPALLLAQAAATGNRSLGLRLLAELDRRSFGHLPGANSVDGTYRRALFAAVLGDTARAIAALDGILQALPTIGSRFLDRPEQTGALVRAMALRADLAMLRHDRKTATTWCDAVIALWGDADAELQPWVKRARAYTKPSTEAR